MNTEMMGRLVCVFAVSLLTACEEGREDVDGECSTTIQLDAEGVFPEGVDVDAQGTV